MEPDRNPEKALYRHIVLEGTSYECGRQLGEHFRLHSPEELLFYTGSKDGAADLTAEALDALRAENDRFCPGINDELRGLADGLGAPLERVTASVLWRAQTGCCSHIAALPGATADGHVLAARSFEWSYDDALCLITTRARGKYAHIGFSVFACGRFDGLNERGLCITMSAGAPGKQPIGGGFLFWAGIRAALDNCACVDEAVERITAMPSCSYVNILVSDRGGNAALIEDACGHRAVRRAGPGGEQYIYSTNHFTLPSMEGHGDRPMWMSAVRHERIGQFLAAGAPAITKETLRALLTAPVPEGLSCRYYTDWFGTLWSMLFDVTAGTVEVCFGPPAVNPWRTFGLDSPVGVTEYPALLPNEVCRDPQFFARV